MSINETHCRDENSSRVFLDRKTLDYVLHRFLHNTQSVTDGQKDKNAEEKTPHLSFKRDLGAELRQSKPN